jgi:hypothetical protein
MNNEPERSDLLADVLAQESQFRTGTLELGLAEIRRAHRRRHAKRMAVALCVPTFLLAAVIYLREFLITKSIANKPTQAAQTELTVPGTSIRVMNDEELLNLFKGRPVALIGPAGHQRLVFFDEMQN